MEIKEFIEKFAEQFEDTDQTLFGAGTKFKELEEWSSLNALSIIAMVDEEFEKRINGEDIRQASTIEDLYEIVKLK